MRRHARAGMALATALAGVADVVPAQRAEPAVVLPVAGAALAFPFDSLTSRWLASPPVATAPGVPALAAIGRRTGDVGALAAGPVTWLAGAIGDDPALRGTGRDVGRSVLLALATTTAIKVLAGRTRPDATADGSPRHWRWLAGLRDEGRRSFPSGHASLSTAAAVSLAWGLRTGGDHGWRDAAALGAYALAGTAILSRVRDRRHWLSDVLAGAALGTASALVVRGR